jgi:hypothetical protein
VSPPDRSAYAARQAELLDALLCGEGYPDGFVAVQADAAGAALRRKRGRAVAHAWPALALCLGDRFDARWDGFDRAAGADAGAEAPGDPLRDGLAFARGLQASGVRLDDDARVEILLARAALRRRGIWVRTAQLQRPHPRLLVAARLPFAGPVHRSVRLRRGATRREPG